MALTKTKIASLRKRMILHKVKGDKAIVELSARELQDLLNAADRTPPKFKLKKVEIPKGDDPNHLYEVTVIVLAPATGDPDQVVEHVMSVCSGHPTHPLPVVNGYGAKVKNLTLSDRRNRSSFGGEMVCTGFTNKPIPKKAEEVNVLVKDQS